MSCIINCVCVKRKKNGQHQAWMNNNSKLQYVATTHVRIGQMSTSQFSNIADDLSINAQDTWTQTKNISCRKNYEP